jgi:hypothetical protein
MSSSATATDQKKTLSAAALPRMKLKNKLFLILFSLLMMGILRTGFVFFVIGMLPAIVAHYMDVSKYRYTFKSIFAANLSGMMPFITKIIFTGPSSTLLQETMGSLTTWITIYGAALIGWLLIKICPMIAQIMVSGVHQTQILRYDWLQKKLESEWGDEVKQMSGENYVPPNS